MLGGQGGSQEAPRRQQGEVYVSALRGERLGAPGLASRVRPVRSRDVGRDGDGRRRRTLRGLSQLRGPPRYEVARGCLEQHPRQTPVTSVPAAWRTQPHNFRIA